MKHHMTIVNARLFRRRRFIFCYDGEQRINKVVILPDLLSIIQSGQHRLNDKKSTPRRGIEPRSPAWQAGILTTILSWRCLQDFIIMIMNQIYVLSTFSRSNQFSCGKWCLSQNHVFATPHTVSYRLYTYVYLCIHVWCVEKVSY